METLLTFTFAVLVIVVARGVVWWIDRRARDG